jgi:hypothetical protein
MTDSWSEEAERIWEAGVEAIREALDRHIGGGLSPSDIKPWAFGQPEDDVPIDVRRAECAMHGPTNAIGAVGRVFCEQCLQTARAGRASEVLTENDEALRMPKLTVYPHPPINFIEVTATVAKGD